MRKINSIWKQTQPDDFFLHLEKVDDGFELQVLDGDGDLYNRLLSINDKGVEFFPGIDKDLGIALESGNSEIIAYSAGQRPK